MLDVRLTRNSRHTHAAIANVASGHVYVMRAQDRRIVASIDVGEQVHHAAVAPGDAWILAANQNGKRLARIRADFVAERFTYSRGDDLNLAALGTATSSDLYVFDRASDALRKHVRLTWTGSDGHGLVATGGGRFLWMDNRGDHNIVVINTTRDAVVGIITGVGAAPDIMGLAPSGRRVYVALRGPNNLTGGPSAKGETPGIAVLEVTDEGRGGRRTAFYPIGDQTPASPADPHTLAVRRVRP